MTELTKEEVQVLGNKIIAMLPAAPISAMMVVMQVAACVAVGCQVSDEAAKESLARWLVLMRKYGVGETRQ